MSVAYVAVGWNRQKKIYDVAVLGGVAAYLLAFVGLGSVVHPAATAETLLIRGLGTLALLLLHVILCVGPLCRLDRRFLPLLYNRRHLGVAMFAVALAHGVFAMVQFHALGDVNSLVSLLSANTRFGSLTQFPFELLGLAALVILFVMASTSHDFWLHLLGAGLWKRLHMLVYFAYALLIGHVCLGALQSETSPVLALVLIVGMGVVVSLHVVAGWREAAFDEARAMAVEDGYVQVGRFDSIPDGRARVVTLDGERVAVFRYGDKVSALSNVCRHQNGPLGEGRIVDGCVTCPWHGYQYAPDSGCSPPPYHDRVATFQTRVVGEMVLVHPRAHAPGTRLEPAVRR